MARIAVTGGTGFVGIHTARALAAAGHDLRLLARGTRSGPKPAGSEWVRADVVEGAGLTEALRGCDAVVHLVAIIRERGRQTFARVNAQGTANVVHAAGEAGVGHLVHISALGVDPDPRYAYLASKWEGEQAVRGGRVPFTILRPSLVFGPGDGFFTQLARLVRLNPLVVPVVGDGRALFQPIAVSDLTRIITMCVERGPGGRVHEVGGPEHLTYEQILEIIEAETGRHRRNVHVPVAAMVPVATIMERVLPNPPVTPGQLRLLERENATRLDAVESEFGFRPLRFADSAAYLHDY